MKTPFARMGAVATCPECKQHFALKAETMARVMGSVASELLGPTPQEIPPPVPPASPVPAAVVPPPPPVAPVPERASEPVERPTVEARRPPPPLAPPPPPKPAAPRYGRNSVWWQRAPWMALIGVVVLLMGVVGGGVWLYFYHAAQSAAATITAIDPQVSLVQFENLSVADWRPLNNEPFKPSIHDGPLKLENEKVVPDGDGGRFQADAVSQGPDLIESARLTLTLVNHNGEAFARTEALLAIISSHQERHVEVAIPHDLYAAMAGTDWKIKTELAIPGGVLFDAACQSVSIGERIGLKIKAYNPVAKPLARAFFLVSAYDHRDRLLGQWMVNWPRPIGPRQPVELGVLQPVGTIEAVRWDAVGAGVAEENP